MWGVCTWKGSIQDTVDVYSARGEESCGFEFEVGQNYLIYARIIEKVENFGLHIRLWLRKVELPVIVTGLCTRTRLLEDAAEDLAELPDVYYKH